jgi:hypothetical protein
MNEREAPIRKAKKRRDKNQIFFIAKTFFKYIDYVGFLVFD